MRFPRVAFHYVRVSRVHIRIRFYGFPGLNVLIFNGCRSIFGFAFAPPPYRICAIPLRDQAPAH